MLHTPLGSIRVEIDGFAVPYAPRLISLSRACPNLNGRYAITVSLPPDGKEHRISCRMVTDFPYEHTAEEGGERLEMVSFYRENAKLSIGVEWDVDCINGRCCSHYDYHVECSQIDISFLTFPYTQTGTFVFGVAWLERVNDKTDIQTWFGADPTLTEFQI